MAWPTEVPPLNNLDQTTDKPIDARADILTLAQLVTQIIVAKGLANGVADLDADILIPQNRLPIVPVERGGGGGTTPTENRRNWNMGDAAKEDVNVANGVAGLNADKELKQQLKGAAAANQSHVNFADGSWGPPFPDTSGWITQAMLNTANGSVSGGNVGSLGNVVLPGGKYGFYPQVKRGNEAIVKTVISANATQTWTTRIAFEITSAGDLGQARQEYVQSSPPYNLGDGDVPLFIFAAFRDKQIVGLWEAQDPPWALNGPTLISGKYAGLQLLTREELADPFIREPYIEKLIAGDLEPVAEGQELKQFDMPEIPSPFDDDVAVALIDPVGDECLRLAEMGRCGYNLGELVLSGDLVIGNEPLKRCGPPGVPCVPIRWKRTS
jgi:hypothetical protein